MDGQAVIRTVLEREQLARCGAKTLKDVDPTGRMPIFGLANGEIQIYRCPMAIALRFKSDPHPPIITFFFHRDIVSNGGHI